MSRHCGREKILSAIADLLSHYKYFTNSISKKVAWLSYLSSHCSPRNHTRHQGEWMGEKKRNLQIIFSAKPYRMEIICTYSKACETCEISRGNCRGRGVRDEWGALICKYQTVMYFNISQRKRALHRLRI